MFFWMMLASLMGIVMYGNLYEKMKPQENFIAPVYEAMALNMYQQHVSTEYGYMDAMKANRTATEAYLNTADDGIVPLAVVENNAIGAGTGGANNLIFPYITGRLPSTFKPQNGTRSYLFCIDKMQYASISETKCSTAGTVRYIMTVRAIPPRYDGADKMTALRAVSSATGNSRFVGMLQKAIHPLTAETGTGGVVVTQHQPLGASYFILSSGIAPVNSVYIPDYLICNMPLDNTDLTKILGDNIENRSYLVALSLISGLQHGENLPVGKTDLCPATSVLPGP